MTLATDWQGENPAGWWLSEKLRGCRAYWDGSRLWSRGGKVITALEWFTRDLPTVPLDGEIYAGRCKVETTSRLAVQYGRFTRRCRFVAFDAPSVAGTWNERMEAAQRAWRDCVEFRLCFSRHDLIATMRDVQAKGGEGLVIRNPKVSRYEVGRTHNTLKVKYVVG